MRKVDDGEEKKKKKKREKKEKNGVFSGHYVIASSLPPERQPLERRKKGHTRLGFQCQTPLRSYLFTLDSKCKSGIGSY